MALSITHSSLADATFSPTGKTDWEAAHTLTGQVDLTTQVTGTLPAGNGGTGITALGTGVATALGINVGSAGAFLTSAPAPSYPVTVAGTVTSGGIPYFSSTTVESSSALLAANGVVVGGGAGAAPNTPANTTLTSSLLTVPALTATGAIIGRDGSGGSPAFASTSSPTTGIWTSQGSNTFFSSGGNNVCGVYASGIDIAATREFRWNSSSNFGGGPDTGIGRAGANQVYFGPSTNASSGVNTRYEINKSITAIADNVATAVLTVTIPNGNHSAGGRIALKAAAGAGGAIGADEFTAYIEYEWAVARTTGVNAVATLSAGVATSTTASVAGGATPTISAALSAISGAVGATNTFTFNVTVHAVTGSSTNHTCFPYATLLNDNTSGCTIA